MSSTHPLLPTSLTHEYDPRTKKLTIRGAEHFLDAIFDIADDIEILDMSFSPLSTLPDDFGRLHALKILFLSYTNFTEVPKVLANCRNLDMIGMKSCKIATWDDDALPANIRAITLTDNQLQSIPPSIGSLTKLKKLMLAGNRLTGLPRDLLHCTNLEGIRIAANQLQTAPNWLFKLPQLAWYSDAGNPFCAAQANDAPLFATIDWDNLEIGDKIGESAKNAVFRAKLKPAGQTVAVKLFGSKVTTDGYPADEFRALAVADTHPNLIPIVGVTTNKSTNQLGLVMQLITPAFTGVGLPPDLHTHTRALYPSGRTFTLPFITTLLRELCDALQHLHHNGVMHGDLYAHNLLANAQGQVYLGDFGGASIYKPGSDPGRQAVDVYAFGLLTQELLNRCPNKTDALHRQLKTLQTTCLNPNSSARPTFKDVAQDLAPLATPA